MIPRKFQLEISKQGFTLIELLIVIAIILILIAIALPNFLEAQTRAKVTKVMGEQRSIRTAMESYFAEFNDYPNWGSPLTEWWHYSRLTTPIPFITEVPADTFAHTQPGDGAVFFDYLVERECVDGEGFCTNLGSQVNVGSGAAVLVGPIGSKANTMEFIVVLPNGLSGRSLWYIGSNGPDWEHEGLSNGGLRYMFSPTNGTKSKGDIITLGP